MIRLLVVSHVAGFVALCGGSVLCGSVPYGSVLCGSLLW